MYIYIYIYNVTKSMQTENTPLDEYSTCAFNKLHIQHTLTPTDISQSATERNKPTIS
jgi:hypothetical protein